MNVAMSLASARTALSRPGWVQLPAFAGLPPPTAGRLRWLWFFLRPYRGRFVLLSLNRLGRMVFFAGVQPLFITAMVTALQNGSAFAGPAVLWRIIGAYIASSAVVYFLLLLCAREEFLYDALARNARLMGLAQLNRLSAHWHENADSGGKLQRILSGAEGLRRMFRVYFDHGLNFLANFIGMALALAWVGLPPLFIALFTGLMVSYIAFAWWTSIRVEQGHERQQRLMEGLVGKVYEFVNATLTVKVFNLGEHVLGHAMGGEKRAHAQARGVIMLDHWRWIGLNFIGLSWVALILYMAARQALGHTIDVAAFVLVAYQALNVWDTLENFTSVYSQWVEEGSALGRLTALLSQQPEVTDQAGAPPLRVESGSITFHNVSFAYNPQAGQVLEGLTLTIAAGEKVGIVGSSGSGKSTLVKLLLRFYDPSRNEITIDRQNIREVSQNSLRQNIAVIPQDIALFNHSVMENIRYGRLDATDDEVLAAARLAHADDFIRRLPAGYATQVGERGTRLSGGQRQRIAIARAILKNAPILVLDEATSALDSESEKLIQQGLEQLMQRKTVLVIAHRLSTISSLDRIVVFDDGKVVEQGPHHQLLAHGGVYARLWAAQVDGFLAVPAAA